MLYTHLGTELSIGKGCQLLKYLWLVRLHILTIPSLFVIQNVCSRILTEFGTRNFENFSKK